MGYAERCGGVRVGGGAPVSWVLVLVGGDRCVAFGESAGEMCVYGVGGVL